MPISILGIFIFKVVAKRSRNETEAVKENLSSFNLPQDEDDEEQPVKVSRKNRRIVADDDSDYVDDEEVEGN